MLKTTLADVMIPRGNLILIRKPDDDVSKILLPESAQEWSRGYEAEVVSVGAGAVNAMTGTRMPIEAEPGVPIKPGDRLVIDGTAAFSPPEWRDEKIALIPENSVWAVIRKDEIPGTATPRLVKP